LVCTSKKIVASWTKKRLERWAECPDFAGTLTSAYGTACVVATSTGPNVWEISCPNVPEKSGPNVPEKSGPNVPEKSGPNVPEKSGPNVPEKSGCECPQAAAVPNSHLDPQHPGRRSIQQLQKDMSLICQPQISPMRANSLRSRQLQVSFRTSPCGRTVQLRNFPVRTLKSSIADTTVLSSHSCFWDAGNSPRPHLRCSAFRDEMAVRRGRNAHPASMYNNHAGGHTEDVSRLCLYASRSATTRSCLELFVARE
jgi:hypothetical protein